MENNPLSQYLGRNLIKALSSLEVTQGKTKDGNIYYSLDFVFSNGYRYRVFLKDAERFAVINAIELSDTQNQIDINFNN